jgi:hypothetical protein
LPERTERIGKALQSALYGDSCRKEQMQNMGKDFPHPGNNSLFNAVASCQSPV